MSAFSQLALQAALYDLLTADSALMNLVAGVFDRPLQGTAFPYVTLGESRGRDFSNVEYSGTEQTFMPHVWSREGGRSETAAIMERLYQLIHNGSPSVSSHTLLLMQFVSSDMSLERDGETYHGTMTGRALLVAD